MDGAILLCLATHSPPREDPDQAQEAIVIAPRWPRRFWYHLLQMMCEIPLLLPHRQDLLSHLADKGVLYHTDLETL